MGGGVGNLGVFTSYQAILEIMICAIAMSKVLLGLHDMVLCKPLIALFIHTIVNNHSISLNIIKSSMNIM